MRPELQPLVDSFRCLAAAIPLLLKYQGTGRVHAVVQEENLVAQRLALDGWLGLVEFGAGPGRAFPGTGATCAKPLAGAGRRPRAAAGWSIQAGRNEFYLVGADYRLVLRPQLPPEQALDASLVNAIFCSPARRITSAWTRGISTPTATSWWIAGATATRWTAACGWSRIAAWSARS